MSSREVELSASSFNRVLKNQHQAFSQGVRRFGKRSLFSAICEHLQKPHTAGSWPQAQFFNTLLSFIVSSGA
jgi:hypothetical protein